jgi:hypothetical protein
MNYVPKEEDSLDPRNYGAYCDRIEGQNLDVYDADDEMNCKSISYVFTVLKTRGAVLSLFSFSVFCSATQVRALRLADPLSKESYQV